MKKQSIRVVVVPVAIAALFAGTAMGAGKPREQSGAAFYSRPPIFAFRPDEKRKGQSIDRFGPVGIGIELTLPAFGMKIKNVESSVPFIATAVRQLGEDELIEGKSKSQYEVTISLTEDAPVGPVNAVLSVNTDLKEAPTVPVKVYGVVRALIHVTPAQVQFGSVESKMRPGRNLIVVNNRSDGARIEITGATVDDPAFVAQVATIEEGRRYQVTVTVKEDADPGSRDATLTLATTDKDFPKVTVPVRANLR